MIARWRRFILYVGELCDWRRNLGPVFCLHRRAIAGLSVPVWVCHLRGSYLSQSRSLPRTGSRRQVTAASHG